MRGIKFLAAVLFVFVIFGLVGHSIAGETGTITGKVVAKKKKYLKDCVVYITQVEGKFAAPEEHAIMDQLELIFIPHVLPILVGQTVDYLNSDPIAHNVFSPDEVADKMNLGTWQSGEIRSYTFTKLGSAVMLCNVHPEMEAYVVILQNPYFCSTKKDGGFTIPNVPPGEYVLDVWNKRFKGKQATVVVKPGETVNVDMHLGKRR